MDFLNETDPQKALKQFKSELVGGKCRWLFSFFAFLSLALLAYLLISREEPNVYFPVFLKGNAAWAAIGLCVIIWGMLAICNWRNWKTGAKKDRVVFDTERVTRIMPSGKTETVRWDELQEVFILTTDEGPMADDVFWMLCDKDGGCAIPSEAEGTKELLVRLQQLPDFDNEAVIKAMGSTCNAKFICWRQS